MFDVLKEDLKPEKTLGSDGFSSSSRVQKETEADTIGAEQRAVKANAVRTRATEANAAEVRATELRTKESKQGARMQ